MNANTVPVGFRTRRNGASHSSGSKAIWSQSATSLLKSDRQAILMLPVE